MAKQIQGITSPYPHENLGRMKVEEQEPDNRRRQANKATVVLPIKTAMTRIVPIAMPETPRKSIQSVNEINRVGYADNPEDCQWNRYPALQHGVPVLERYIYKVHGNIKSEYNYASGSNLSQKLHFGRKFKSIIQGSDQTIMEPPIRNAFIKLASRGDRLSGRKGRTAISPRIKAR